LRTAVPAAKLTGTAAEKEGTVQIGQFEIVIGTPGTGAELQTAVGVPQKFVKPVAGGRQILCAWYHPVDNLTNLYHFDALQIVPDPAYPNALAFNVRVNQPAVVRLAVTYFYLP
jgi:hypothetical protein